jgi:hypothetical protein
MRDINDELGQSWWAEGYERLWVQSSAGSAPRDGECSRGAATEEDCAEGDEEWNDPEKLLATPMSRDRVVYLTGDSTDVLEELKEGDFVHGVMGLVIPGLIITVQHSKKDGV